jgi:hypothetical protein
MMSTKATGDSHNGAGGAVEADVASEGAESVTAVATVLENAVLDDAAVDDAVSEGAAVEGAASESAVDGGLEGTEPTPWNTAAPSAWVVSEQTPPDAENGATDEAETDGSAAHGATADDRPVDATADDRPVDATADDRPVEKSVGDAEAAVAVPDAAGTDEPVSGDAESALAEPGETDAVGPGESESAPSEAGDGDDLADDAGTYEEFDGEHDEEYSVESHGEYDGEYSEEYGEYEAAEGEYEAENGEYEAADGEYEAADGEYEAENGEYEAADAKPRRARRWPRVLMALGFVVLGAGIVGGAYAIVGKATHNFKQPPPVIKYTESKVFSLKTGECFDPDGQSYTLISCNSPHVAEVFATFKLSGAKWPGDTALAAAASGGCATRLTDYLNPQLALSLTSAYVYPDATAWQGGTKTVICEVRAAKGNITGSVRGASATAS